MIWRKRSSKRPYFLDLIFSKEIIYDAYREGFINWNVYKTAIEKITSNMNGSWMFEKGSVKIDFNKMYRDMES
jgi:hypothetical protein